MSERKLTEDSGVGKMDEVWRMLHSLLVNREHGSLISQVFRNFYLFYQVNIFKLVFEIWIHELYSTEDFHCINSRRWLIHDSKFMHRIQFPVNIFPPTLIQSSSWGGPRQSNSVFRASRSSNRDVIIKNLLQNLLNQNSPRISKYTLSSDPWAGNKRFRSSRIRSLFCAPSHPLPPPRRRLSHQHPEPSQDCI